MSGPSRRPSAFRRGVVHRSRRLPPIPGGVPGCLPASARLPAADEAPRVIEAPVVPGHGRVGVDFPTKLRSTSGRNLLITNGFRRTAAQAPTRWSCPSKQCRGPTEPIGSSGDENLQFVASTFHPHSRAPSDARHRSGVVGLRSRRGKGASEASLVRLVEMAHHSAPAVGMFGDYVDSRQRQAACRVAA